MSRRRRGPDPDLHGVILIDKPAGPTSHDVVGWVRWVLGVRRVGHCGTLDPAATGLLVVGVGLATKLAPYLTGADKTYRARFRLGARTTTADADGEIVEQVSCPPDLEARVASALVGLCGSAWRAPPVYSAIHVGGKRAHALARAGEAPVMEPRLMTVHDLQPGPVTRDGSSVDVDATLRVSKGTYIRSLAEALGAALGVPAHLRALHRIGSGALSLEHPRARLGVVARRDPAAAERPPRWRLGLRDPAHATREAMAEHLRAGLLMPAEAVPLPLLRVLERESGKRAMARLASGQAVEVDDPGLPRSIDPAERLAVAPADPADAGLVVVRREGQPPQWRLQPERVVVPPRSQPLTAP